MSFGYVTPSTGFTIECWFKRDALPATYEALFGQRTQAVVNWPGYTVAVQGRQFELDINSAGALDLYMFNESTNSAVSLGGWTDPSPSGYANDNEWHHIAFRVSDNKSTWALFLDGQVLHVANTNAIINWNPGFLTFGAAYAPHLGNFGSYIWDGWLAYIAVYNTGLSQNRIQEHYTAGAGGTVYYGDDEVTRMIRIADWAEVPDQSREFEEAVTNLQGIQVDGTNALTAFQDAASSAGGLVFSDGQSRMVYHNRRHRYNRWNAITLGESLQSAPEVGITFTVDDEAVYNDIRGERPYGSNIRVVDAISKAAHGRKTYPFSIAVTTHAELEHAVNWIAQQYRYPRVRVSEVSFRAESSELIEWLGTGGVTIGDHITLIELPQEAAPEESMEFVIDQISVDVDIKNRIYTVSMQLSPYEINSIFRVGVSNLGTEHRLGY